MTNKKKQMDIPDEKLIPYNKRADLTAKEINALNHYKDLINKQYQWDYKPKKRNESVGIDCQMVNEYLREDIPEKRKILSCGDKIRLGQIISLIDSAISKSYPKEELILYKGLKMFRGLEDVDLGKDIKDGAFASFTTDLHKAAPYSKKNKRGEYIFYQIEVTEKDNALYIDKDEDEWLLPRGYNTILGIDQVKNFAGKSKAIIYHVERRDK